MKTVSTPLYLYFLAFMKNSINTFLIMKMENGCGYQLNRYTWKIIIMEKKNNNNNKQQKILLPPVKQKF